MPRHKGNARDDGSPYENMQTEDQWGGPPRTPCLWCSHLEWQHDENGVCDKCGCYGFDPKPAGECPAVTDGKERS